MEQSEHTAFMDYVCHLMWAQVLAHKTITIASKIVDRTKAGTRWTNRKP